MRWDYCLDKSQFKCLNKSIRRAWDLEELVKKGGNS